MKQNEDEKERAWFAAEQALALVVHKAPIYGGFVATVSTAPVKSFVSR